MRDLPNDSLGVHPGGASSPEIGIWEVLKSAAERSGEDEFRPTEEGVRVLLERVLEPAARKFLRSNSREDFDDVVATGWIAIGKAFRTLLAKPSISTTTKEAREGLVKKYLFTTLQYAFLKAFCPNSLQMELKQRLNRALQAESVFAENEDAFYLAGAEGVPLFPAENVESLADSLGTRRGSGHSSGFSSNLPTPRELEDLAAEAMAETGCSFKKGLLVDLARLVFEIEDNREESLQAPVSQENSTTLEETTADVAKEFIVTNEPPEYSLPHEVDDAEAAILEVLKRLDSTPSHAATRPFFHAFFEFWLWERQGLADGMLIGATEYQELTGIADATTFSRKKKFEREMETALRTHSESATLAALTRLKEENVKIFRKRWRVSSLTGEKSDDEQD
jgi:hypothetical protein